MNNEVVWRPVPQSSQELALSCTCSIILLSGSRGSMKSDSQLMMFRKHVGKGYGQFWRGVLYDISYKGLDDLVARSKRWFLAFNDGARFLTATSMYKWVWPTGEELLFRSGSTEADYMKDFHGQEFPWIGGNEITKNPSPVFHDSIMSCNRSSFSPEKDSPKDPTTGRIKLLPPIPLQVVNTTNPFGPGKAWVKKQYIDPAPYGKVVRNPIEIISPQTKQKMIVTRSQVTIFSSYVENIHLTAEYIAELHKEKNENKKKAWLYGSWDYNIGGAFAEYWDAKIHIVEDFPIPKSWHIERAFDWGSTHPFSVGWFAKANGEEVTLPSGKKFCPAAGSLIRIYEWYGSKKENWGKNIGLAKSSSEIAQGIVEIENHLKTSKRVSGTIYPGPADNQIGNVIDRASSTIADSMAKEGILWEPSIKSSGSRVSGCILFKDRLHASVVGEGPGFYVMRNCEAAIYFIPEFKAHEKIPDEVDSDTEDHCLHGNTLVDTALGQFPIKDLVGTEGYVLTLEGKYTRYTDCRLTRKNSTVIRVIFENGKSVVCTPDHKFYTEEGWIEAQYLLGKVCYNAAAHTELTGEDQCSYTRLVKQFKNLMENVFTSVSTIFRKMEEGYTASFTATIMERLLKENISTTKTTTSLITRSKILNSKKHLNTEVIMANTIRILTGLRHVLMEQLHGTRVKKVLRGIKNITKKLPSTTFILKQNWCAYTAQNIFQEFLGKTNFVQIHANPHGVENRALTTKHAVVNYVEPDMLSTNTSSTNSALYSVQEKLTQLNVMAIEPAGIADVYCLEAEGTHAFSVEGGIVVHNCWDELRYMCLRSGNILAQNVKVHYPR